MPQFFQLILSRENPVVLEPKAKRDALQHCGVHIKDFGKSSKAIATRFFPMVGLKPSRDFFDQFARVYIVGNKMKQNPLLVIQKRSLLSKEEEEQLRQPAAEVPIKAGQTLPEEKKEAPEAAEKKKASGAIRQTTASSLKTQASVSSKLTQAASSKKLTHMVNSASSKKVGGVAGPLRSSRLGASKQTVASARTTTKLGDGPKTSTTKLRVQQTMGASLKKSAPKEPAKPQTASQFGSRKLAAQPSVKKLPQASATARPRPFTAKAAPSTRAPVASSMFDIQKPQLCLVTFLTPKGKLSLMMGPMKKGKFFGRNVMLVESQKFGYPSKAEEKFRVVIGPCKPNATLIKGSVQPEDTRTRPEFEPEPKPDYKTIDGFIGRVRVFWLRIGKSETMKKKTEHRQLSDNLNSWTGAPFVLGSYQNKQSNYHMEDSDSIPLIEYEDEPDLRETNLLNGSITFSMYGEVFQQKVKLKEDARGKQYLSEQLILGQSYRKPIEELLGLVNTDKQGKVKVG